MSEKKEGDEDLVEHGHGHGHEHGDDDSEHGESSESDQMVETDIRHEEEDDDSPEEEHDESHSSEDGDREEALLNGDDHSYSPKVQPFDGGSSSSDEVKAEDNVVQTEAVELVNGGAADVREGDDDNNNVEKLKNVDELTKNVEELKDRVEVNGSDELKKREWKEEKVNSLAVSHLMEENGVKEEKFVKHESVLPSPYVIAEGSNQSFPSHLHYTEGDDADGTEAEQAAFAKELEGFFRERGLDFKHPKFYGEGLNCLKLWRAVTRLGGYDRVTACKLWRQVGESFKPPKTCTTVSWSFRIFYEKALLDYERHKTRGGELIIPASPLPEALNVDSPMHSGSGRARRDAAARAMQGWHSQRLLGNGEVGDPIIRDKNSLSTSKREKHLKTVGLLKRKKPTMLDRSVKAARTITKVMRPQIDTDVTDIGPAADWVKISVRRTKDCFEVYALVPGLLREEVRVQSDPAGRLVISGEPEQPDNPWGVTPFKKVITLPSRIDPHQTSAVVTLHGQLFVRVPFEPTDL